MLSGSCVILFVAGTLCATVPQTTTPDLCRQGQQLIREGKFQQALEAASQALTLDPSSAEAEEVAGTAQFGLGNLPSAQQHMQRALALQPNRVTARRALGATFLRERQFKEARREFETVLRATPRDYVARVSLGMTYLLDHQPGAALQEFQRASELQPDEPAVLSHTLEAYIMLGQEESSEKTLSMLDAKLGPRDPRRVEIAWMLVKSGAYKLAIREFESLRKTYPDSQEIAYNLALAYHRSGQEAAAANILHDMLSRHDDAELESLLGEVRFAMSDPVAGIAAYHRAVELAPQSDRFRFDLAQAMVSQWKLAQAVRLFESGVKDFPNSANMWLGFGATYYLAGNYLGAAKILLQATDTLPDNPAPMQLLGLVYDAAGSLQTKIQQKFEHYIEKNPRDPWGLYYYGKMLASPARANSTRNLERAQNYLEKAIRLAPRLPEPHLELGIVLEECDHSPQALQELQRAAELNPKSSAAFYHISQVYRKLGDQQNAQRATTRFEELKALERADLDNEQIQLFLARQKLQVK